MKHPPLSFLRIVLMSLLCWTVFSTSGFAAPRVVYKQRILANGLTLLAVSDKRLPRVALQMWYRVGGKNDPENRTGLAHFYERLMFEATRYLPSGGFDQLTAEAGGSNNAFTDYDYTLYYENIPSNYLEVMLWAEAERLTHLVITEPSVQAQRTALLEEYRETITAPPYGRLDVLIPQYSFPNHPYRRPVIGTPDDIAHITADDLRAFQRKYYRPDNAVLVVVGDFDQGDLDKWTDRYFGSIARSETPLERSILPALARTEEHRYKVTNRAVPLPALILTYQTPGIGDSDMPVLDILQAALSDGESSRLYRELIIVRHNAASAVAYRDSHQEAGLFVLRITLASGKKFDDLERISAMETDRLRTQLLSPAELEKAKRRATMQTIRDRQTMEGIATALGSAAVLQGDPERVNGDFARLEKVTADDVRRVAQKYLLTSNRVVIRYSAEGTVAGLPADSEKAVPANSVTAPVREKPTIAPITKRKAVRGMSRSRRYSPKRRYFSRHRTARRRTVPLVIPTISRSNGVR